MASRGRSPRRGRGDPRPSRSFAVRGVSQASAVAARQELNVVVAPPPEALVNAAAMYSCCRAAVRGDTSEAALAELEEILGQAHMVADAGEYYRGWCNAAAYVAACGLAERLDVKNPQHLPVILAHTDKRAVLARLGLSALVRHVPHQATPLRPFPLEAIGAHRAQHDRAATTHGHAVPPASLMEAWPCLPPPSAPSSAAQTAPPSAAQTAAPSAAQTAANRVVGVAAPSLAADAASDWVSPAAADSVAFATTSAKAYLATHPPAEKKITLVFND